MKAPAVMRTRGGVWVERGKRAEAEERRSRRNLHKGCTGLEQLSLPISSRVSGRDAICSQPRWGTAMARGLLCQATCSTGPTRKNHDAVPVKATAVRIAKAQ